MSKAIGTEIKRRREAAGINQQAFSERVEISRNYLSLVETGARMPSKRLLAQINDMLTLVEKDGTGGGGAGTHRGTNESLKAEIRSHLEDTIIAARDDMARLGWIREQQIRHVSAPEHWDAFAIATEQLMEEERTAAKAAEKSASVAQSRKAQ